MYIIQIVLIFHITQLGYFWVQSAKYYKAGFCTVIFLDANVTLFFIVAYQDQVSGIVPVSRVYGCFLS